jgi:hypothetical protein
MALDPAIAGTAKAAIGAAGASALPAERQLCGSSESKSRFFSVGRRSKTSFRYAHGSCPLSLADSIRLSITPDRSPACWEPTNNQFLRPIASGRIAFSAALLSIGTSPSTR